MRSRTEPIPESPTVGHWFRCATLTQRPCLWVKYDGLVCFGATGTIESREIDRGWRDAVTRRLTVPCGTFRATPMRHRGAAANRNSAAHSNPTIHSSQNTLRLCTRSPAAPGRSSRAPTPACGRLRCSGRSARASARPSRSTPIARRVLAIAPGQFAHGFAFFVATKLLAPLPRAGGSCSRGCRD